MGRKRFRHRYGLVRRLALDPLGPEKTTDELRMKEKRPIMKNMNESGSGKEESSIAPQPDADQEQGQPPQGRREVGGPPGLEPTRYGDWEKAGRCIDF